MNRSNAPRLLHIKVLCSTSFQIFSVYICSCSFVPEQKRECWMKKKNVLLSDSKVFTEGIMGCFIKSERTRNML